MLEAIVVTADAVTSDATYGRIEGDLALRVAAGAGFGPRAPRGVVDLRLRYLQSAGFFASYEEGFGGSSPRRLVAVGLELRPLFLGRWLTGLELGKPYPDLLFDSFAFEIGAFFGAPAGGDFGDRYGLQFGGALELPFFPRATGLWLSAHVGVRWDRAVFTGRDPLTADDRAVYFNILLAWQQIFPSHASDFGDERPR